MLSLSSINSPSPGTQVVPMTRPALTQEAVRSASPLAEIQPATAISRERSRVEAKPQNPATVAEQANQTQAEQAVAAEQQAAAQKAAGRNGNQGTAFQSSSEKPPSEKNSIQKAMEVQIKDVLNTVWKASGRAADFLLGRRETLMDATLKEVLLPGEVDYLGASASSGKQAAAIPTSNSSGDMVQYTALGGAGGLGDGKGQILDMVV